MNRGKLKGMIGKALIATYTAGLVISSYSAVQAKAETPAISATTENATAAVKKERAIASAEKYLTKLGETIEAKKSSSAIKSALKTAQRYVDAVAKAYPDVVIDELTGYANIAAAEERIADLVLIDAAKNALAKLPGSQKAADSAVKTTKGRDALIAKVADADEVIANATEAGVASEVEDLFYYARLAYAKTAIENSVDVTAPVISYIQVNGKMIKNVDGVFTVTIAANEAINKASIYADEAGTLTLTSVEGYDADVLGVDSVDFKERGTISLSQLLGDLDQGVSGITGQTFKSFDSDNNGFEVTGTVTDSLNNSTDVTLVIKVK